MRRSRQQRGFTLVEMMVVVALIAIMAGVATPALLGSLPAIRVNGAARQVLGDLRYARTLAVEKGANAYLAIDGSGSYTVWVDSDDDGVKDTAEVQSVVDLDDADYNYKDITLGTNYSTSSFSSGDEEFPLAGGDAVMFRPNGSASTSGSVYLMPGRDVPTQGNRNDRNRRVLITAASGSARIENWDGSTWE